VVSAAGLDLPVFVLPHAALLQAGARQRRGLDTGAVLLSAGLVTTVISVAMENTITACSSANSLGIDRPYQVGDWIEF